MTGSSCKSTKFRLPDAEITLGRHPPHLIRFATWYETAEKALVGWPECREFHAHRGLHFFCLSNIPFTKFCFPGESFGNFQPLDFTPLCWITFFFWIGFVAGTHMCVLFIPEIMNFSSPPRGPLFLLHLLPWYRQLYFLLGSESPT